VRPPDIARDLMVSEIILAEFRKLGVKVISADGGVDLTLGNDDPTGKLVRQILAAVSEWEKCLIVQKLRASRLRMRRSGQRCGGRKPYGETPEEQTVIQKMKAWRGEGKSLAEIAETLNLENVPTRTGTGTQWHPTQIQRVLKRP
jgi:DNA invertase Pin-like site-specific DNA recombinase